MIKNLTSLKKSDFLKSLGNKLSAKGIEVENVSKVGNKTIKSRPMIWFDIVLSDTQTIELFVDAKSGNIEYASIDDVTVQDFDEANTKKMPTILADQVIKRSGLKAKQELFKNIEVEKFSNSSSNKDEKRIEELKAQIETKKANITDLKSKLPTVDGVDTDGIVTRLWESIKEAFIDAPSSENTKKVKKYLSEKTEKELEILKNSLKDAKSINNKELHNFIVDELKKKGMK